MDTPRRRFRFALKPLQELLAMLFLDEIGVQNFYSDATLNIGIKAFIDNTHGAFTK
jgi:hypothetical protein